MYAAGTIMYTQSKRRVFVFVAVAISCDGHLVVYTSLESRVHKERAKALMKLAELLH